MVALQTLTLPVGVRIPIPQPKEKVASAAFSFCSLHFFLFVLLSSLRFPPRLFPVKREERKEKRKGSFATQSIDLIVFLLYNLSMWR